MKIGDIYLYKLDDRQVIVAHINHKAVTVRYVNYQGDYKTMMVDEKELYEGKKEV